MADSATVIVALRYRDGIVFASDSQASDLVQRVRWETTKARQVGDHPLVMAFSGNMGVARRARSSVEGRSFKATTFQRRERGRKMIESALAEHYDWIASRMKPESAFKEVVGMPQMVVLAACWAEDSPTIIEYGQDGDSEFHEYFHAVGSGATRADRGPSVTRSSAHNADCCKRGCDRRRRAFHRVRCRQGGMPCPASGGGRH